MDTSAKKSTRNKHIIILVTAITTIICLGGAYSLFLISENQSLQLQLDEAIEYADSLERPTGDVDNHDLFEALHSEINRLEDDYETLIKAKREADATIKDYENQLDKLNDQLMTLDAKEEEDIVQISIDGVPDAAIEDYLFVDYGAKG